jgi:hypothetical protein
LIFFKKKQVNNMSSIITSSTSEELANPSSQISTVVIPISSAPVLPASEVSQINGSASGIAAAIERLAASIPDGDEVDEGDDENVEGGSSNLSGSRFYWETSDPSAPAPTLPVVVADHCRWIALQTWSTMEVVGEFFAEILGLQNSRYEWAMELARRHEEDAEEEELRTVRRQRWAEIQAATREQARIDRARESNGGNGIVAAEERQGLVQEEGNSREEGEEGEGEEVVNVDGETKIK